MKRHLVKFIIVFVIVVGLVFVGYYIPPNKNSVEHREKVTYANNKKLEEIRNREDIKRKQELIVQETYLIEKKKRIEQEKEDAIQNFSSQLNENETKLETIRSEMLSFL